MADDFAQAITTAYATDGAALDLGRGVHDGAVVTAATVKLPLRMVDRHGLIAGATGTGKTKTLQGIAEQLSSAGVPVFVSTALMWLLAQLFEELPEAGDLDKPKLAFFFDEAHLLFEDATKAFLTSVAQTVRLIRSKGVGVHFITQTPKDVPSEILGQLGTRVDNQSAREILAARMAPPAEEAEEAQPVRPKQAAAPHRQPAAEHKEAAGAMAGGVAAVTSFLNSREGKQLQKQVVRGVFGLLKKKLPRQ
jgi:hypothetical protein